MGNEAEESSGKSVAVLADEYVARMRAGESPSIEEYTQNYPHLAEEIREIFGALGMVEQLKPDTVDILEAHELAGHAKDSYPAIPDYHILAEIGRGGMGVVFEAEQISLGRRVAVKVLPPSHSLDRNAVERFREEARAAAALHHSNIVPVFEVGNAGEHNYYAMQYIVGDGLDRVIEALRSLRNNQATSTAGEAAADVNFAERKEISAAARQVVATLTTDWADSIDCDSSDSANSSDSLADKTQPLNTSRSQNESSSRQRNTIKMGLSSTANLEALVAKNRFYRNVAQIGVQVSQALQHAHDHGILHRDIKPSNILLDTDGRPWIADFGLAKQADVNLTQTGNILGTLRYMSPERFSGPCEVVGDVYSLGATLYELLSLQPIFAASDHLQLVDLIKEGSPVELSSHDAAIPRDLQTIVEKSLENEPQRRYQTALALAEDLQRFLDGRPILARRVSLLEKLTLWAKSNRAVAGLLSLVFFGLFAAAVGTLLGAIVFRQIATEAQTQALLAEEVSSFWNEDILGASNPMEGIVDQNTTLVSVLDQAAAEIDGRFADSPMVEGQLRRTIGEAFLALGQFDAAGVHLKKSCDLLVTSLGESSSETMESRLQLGRFYLEEGSLVKEAESEIGSVYDWRVKNLGAKHPDTLTAQYELAQVYHADDEREREVAIALLEEVWASRKEVLGTTHRDTLRTLIRIGRLKTFTDLQGAIPMLVDALAKAEAELGPQDMLTLVARFNLAEARGVEQNLEAAVELLNENLDVTVAWLGELHPQTIKTLEAIARMHHRAGHSDKQIAVLRDIIRRSESTYGPEHIATLELREHLADELTGMNQHEEARQILNATRAIHLSQDGEGSESVVYVDLLLGKIDANEGDFEAAEEKIGRAYNSLREQFGTHSLQTAPATQALIKLYVKTGQLEKAIPLMETMREMAEELYGANSMIVVTMLQELSFVYGGCGDSEGAENVLRDAIKKIKEFEHQGIAQFVALNDCRTRLAESVASQERYDEGLELVKQAIAFDEWPPDLRWKQAKAYFVAGYIYAKQEKYAIAKTHLMTAEERFTDDSIAGALPMVTIRRMMIPIYKYLALSCEELNEPEEAQKWIDLGAAFDEATKPTEE